MGGGLKLFTQRLHVGKQVRVGVFGNVVKKKTTISMA